jgi:hypothetical protein
LKKRISRGGLVYLDRHPQGFVSNLKEMKNKEFTEFSAKHSTLLEDKIGKFKPFHR